MTHSNFKSILLFLFFKTFCLSQNIIYTTNQVQVFDFVGSGFSGFIDGNGNQTMFEPPIGKYLFSMTKSKSDVILFIDGKNQDRIRFVTMDGLISTVPISNTQNTYNLIAAGPNGSTYVLMTPIHGWPAYPIVGSLVNNAFSNLNIGVETANGVKTSSGMCVDSKNNIFISSQFDNKIYKVSSSGLSEVFVGSGDNGNRDGNGLFCSFSFPLHLACDLFDNIYVWDSGNNLIRKIDKNRNVTTFSGSKSSVSYSIDGPKDKATFGYGSITGICSDSNGKIYISSDTKVREIDQSGYVRTLVGNSESGYINGSAQTSRFNEISGITCIGNNIFVAETKFPRIRKITIGQNSTKKPIDNISIKLSAGITINGTVGKKYSIESSSDGGKQWNQVIELDLQKTPYTWYDEKSVGTNSLYRVFETP